MWGHSKAWFIEWVLAGVNINIMIDKPFGHSFWIFLNVDNYLSLFILFVKEVSVTFFLLVEPLLAWGTASTTTWSSSVSLIFILKLLVFWKKKPNFSLFQGYRKYAIVMKVGSFSWTLQVPPENEEDNVNEWTKNTQASF